MKYIACLLLLIFFACCQPEAQHPASAPAADTTIVTYNTINHSKLDSASCVTYTVSIGGRNTGFTCNACQHIGEFFRGKVDIMMSGEYSKPISYRMELHYLKQILPLVGKRFPIDSLDCISMRRISYHPDLAVNLSKEFAHQFGNPDRRIDPQSIYVFLDTSVAAKDFDKLLLPYSVKVKHVGVEKLSTSRSKRNLLDKDALESDTTQIPDKVLDGTLYIYVQKY